MSSIKPTKMKFMKNLNIASCLLLLMSVFLCCEKDLSEVSNTSSDITEIPQPIGINKQLIDQFFGGDLATKNITMPTVYEGLLHFQSKQDVVAYYDDLKTLSDNWDYEARENQIYNESVLGDPAIATANNEIGFVSLSDHYDVLDYENSNYREEIDDYIGTPVLQALLSNQREIAVAGKIYKHLSLGRIGIIDNLSYEALDDLRVNGLHSEHPDVEYYNPDDDTYYINDDHDGGGVNPSERCNDGKYGL